MTDERIHRVVMPKWGLSMSRGTITQWLVSVGDHVEEGTDLAEVETDKIAGTLESTQDGLLRAIVADAGDDVPVSATIALLAPPEVEATEITAAAEQAKQERASTDTPEETGPTVSTVEVNGHTLSHATLGTGQQTVLLVHGYGGDKNSWLFVHEPLAEHATVHALDLPGHGESSKDVGDGSLPALADTVLGFLDTHAISTAHLVGHSLGGAVVAAAAAAAADRVNSLTLIAPAGYGPRIDADFMRGFAAATTRRELKPHVAKLFADPDLVTRRLLEDLMKYKRLDGVPQALHTLQTTLLDGDQQALDTPTTLAATGVPTTVLWGADDQILPAPEHADDTRADWDVVTGAGHMLHMERPHTVRDAVLTHLSRSDDNPA